MAKDKDQEYNPPPGWASVFGDADDPSVYLEPQDAPGPPKPNSSAVAMDRRRRDQLRDAARARVNETIATAAQIDGDARAYQRVMDEQAQGEPSTYPDKVAAARYAKAQGLVPRQSSAERLARQGSW